MTGQNPPDPPISTDERLMTPPRATAMPVPACRHACACCRGVLGSEPVRRRRPLAQRGPRQAPDRRLRGARGLPGAGRVPQPPAGARRRGAPLDRRHGPRDRVRRRPGDRDHAARQRLRLPAPRPGRLDRRRRRGALARVGAPAGHQRRDLRVLRARQEVGRRPGALPPARRRRPARRRPARRRGRLPAPRPAARHRAAARHRQARAHARVPGLPQAGPRPGPHARGAPALRAPRARRRPRAGRRRPRPPLEPAQVGRLGDRAPPRRRRPGRRRVRPPRGHAGALLAGLAGLLDRSC